MKRKESFEQLEKLFHTSVVPEIDVKQKVMSAIYKKQAETEERKVKKKIGLLVTVGLLVGATTAFAAMQVIQLKDDKGEVVYQVQKLENQETNRQQLPPEVVEEDKLREAELQRVMKIVNDIKDGLKPGKAVAIYVVPKLPKPENIQYAPGVRPDIWVISKQYEFDKLEELQAKLGKKMPVAAELSSEYRFSKAYVRFKENRNFDDAPMREEAKKYNKEYVVREVGLSNKLDETVVYYQGNNGKVTVHINNVEDIKGMITEGSEHASAEKVMVGGNEAIYRVWNFDENGVKDQSISNNRVIDKSVSWIKNGTKLRYNVSSQSKDITKEELIKLAEQLIQEN